MQLLLDAKRAEAEAQIAGTATAEKTLNDTTVASADSSYPASSTLCNKCHTKAVIIMDNCATCLACGYPKCFKYNLLII